jgi:hypothetical protein
LESTTLVDGVLARGREYHSSLLNLIVDTDIEIGVDIEGGTRFRVDIEGGSNRQDSEETHKKLSLSGKSTGVTLTQGSRGQELRLDKVSGSR